MRYVIINGTRYLLTAFVNDNAVVEEPASGRLAVFKITQVQFDPPTEILMAQQEAPPTADDGPGSQPLMG